MPKGTYFIKPEIVVEAVQFEGTPQSAIAVCDAFEDVSDNRIKFRPNPEDLREGKLDITTEAGEPGEIVNSGDWVLHEPGGKLFAITDTAFETLFL